MAIVIGNQVYGVPAIELGDAFGFQPLDSDLTAIAALTTTSYGRGLLTSVSAAALFASIKQDATDTATGVVELATTTEAQAGTDTTRAITAAGLRAATREKLTANRTYYVRTDGSDSNDGLANTSGGALLTLQAAWNKVAALDLSIYAVTIKVADGTYTGVVALSSMPVGGSSITIEGNTTTPANCHINATATCFLMSAPLPCAMTIKGFKMTFTGSSLSAVRMDATGTITVSSNELAGGSTGFAGAYRVSVRGAQINISTGHTISGGMSCFCQAFGGFIQIFSVTVTLTGTPAWSWTGVVANDMGEVSAVGVTFSGAATGTRYTAQTGGGINSGGGGASYFPGNVAGSATSPGWYL
nr:hypothetical protein RAR13_11895 [Aminobacter aminovorans]